jgi:hypothetical protein
MKFFFNHREFQVQWCYGIVFSVTEIIMDLVVRRIAWHVTIARGITRVTYRPEVKCAELVGTEVIVLNTVCRRMMI